MASEKKSTTYSVMEGAAASHLLDVLRNVETGQVEYAQHADRLCRLLAEEGLAFLAKKKKEEVTITTPCGKCATHRPYAPSDVCAVSIVRSGDILLQGVCTTLVGVNVGKILIQRDEDTALPELFYSKLPKNISDLQVLLVDPMLATGGSAIKAIEVLKEQGVKEKNVLFLNIVACPEGLEALAKATPEVFTLTVAVDECLNEQKYIVPGLGDFGDRYFGTQ